MVEADTSSYQTIDNLHRVLAEELIRYQSRIASGVDNEHSTLIKATFDKSNGVPKRLTWDVINVIDDSHTWEILDFEFLDE